MKLRLLTAVLLLLAAPVMSRAQAGRAVSGTVTDTSGEPVIGAAVIIQGTLQGTMTDLDGKFTIEVAGPSTVLEISSISYRTQTVTVGGRDKFTIVLEDDSTVLSEAVVVGFGTQKRENLTGAVATISAKELNNRPVVSAANALQGLDPSVNITLGTGSPESTYNIDIRGAASINSSSPLILVDGIEMDLRAVNPNDIESVSVLKDASASSIYGAKASAGVILVTTKTGKSVGNDIRKGKCTLMVTYTLENLKDEKKLARFKSILGDMKATEAEVKEAMEIMRDIGAIEYNRKAAEDKIASAKKHLECLPESEHKEFMLALANYSINREV